MKRDLKQEGRRKKGRSAAQQEWNAAVARASQAWEYLTDQERLTWNTAAELRCTSGQRYFVQVNAPRLRDNKELLRLPPPAESPISRRILKRFVITNRGGRVALKLHLAFPPKGRFTVWASRPCRLGVSRYVKCPRLGLVPEPKGLVSEITALYFQKHGEYIVLHGRALVGMRIVVRVRQELAEGSRTYEEAREIVPPPEHPAWGPKKT
jgi:hypothetical protein